MVPLALETVALTRLSADVLERQAHRGEARRVDLHVDGALPLAADEHLRDAGDLRDLLRQDVVGVVVDVDQRQLVGLNREDQDRASDGLTL